MKNILLQLVAASALAVSFSGCGANGNSGPMEYVGPDMKNSFAVKAQKLGPDGIGARAPVEGTVFQGQPEAYTMTPEEAMKNPNPLPRTKENILRGQHLFNTYCIVCHGKRGEGDGNVVPKFPRPPSLQSEKVRGWPDGRIFHVITMGQNLMQTYATQVSEKDRWAIIHYIRVLQRSLNPTAEDVKALENSKK